MGGGEEIFISFLMMILLFFCEISHEQVTFFFF